MTAPEELARAFHAAYEELAPQFGYTTKPETREFSTDSPNGRLMIAVADRIMSDLIPAMLAAAEARGAAREREAIAVWCADEADRCDDAAKWGGARAYVANCKAAAYALRNACNVIRKGIA